MGNQIKIHYPKHRSNLNQQSVAMESIIDILSPKNEEKRDTFLQETAEIYLKNHKHGVINMKSNKKQVIERINDQNSTMDCFF